MKDKTVYSIGQILTYTQDVETHRALSDTPEIIKKGTKVIVGADGFVRYPDGSIQKLGDNIEVSGYDTQGLASFIYNYLCRNTCGFSEMMEEWEDDITEESLKEHIADALEELGMYDHV
jgi:hypothetical protein